MEKYIEIASHWGTARNEYIAAGRGRLAVILPGQRYTNMAPLLYYPLGIALESGCDALALEYGFQRGAGEFHPDSDSLAHMVSEAKEAIDICLNGKSYSEILFIGKSLGTLAEAHLINEFAQYPQRHIFLTPLPECIGVIKKADCMVVVGTNDRVFGSEHIAKITGLENVKLVTIEGADHRLEKGGYSESLGVLKEVCDRIYGYINY